MNRREVWTRGEVAAKEYLLRKGYVILKENYSCALGEIDLIARDGEVIVFVEVKARETDAFGTPIEAVTPTKVAKICRTAQYYLVRERRLGAAVRFDVVEVFCGDIRHTENAFSLNDAAKYIKY